MTDDRQSPPAPGGPVVLQVVGPLVRDDVPRLCRQARDLLVDVVPGTPVECDVTALGTPDAIALDALARLQLTAIRLGHRVALRGASPALRALLRGSGLCTAVPEVPERSTAPSGDASLQPDPSAGPRGEDHLDRDLDGRRGP